MILQKKVAGLSQAALADRWRPVPGLRMLDKYAVRCGGGQNHRLDLSDGVLIKNNHIALAGGIVPALERAHKNRRGAQIIEIEVRSLDELEQALLTLLRSPELSLQMGDAARRTVVNGLTLSHQAQQLAAIYREMSAARLAA